MTRRGQRLTGPRIPAHGPFSGRNRSRSPLHMARRINSPGGSAPWTSRGKEIEPQGVSVRATRNPLMQRRLPGEFQPRLAARRLRGPPLQLPPRGTRTPQFPPAVRAGPERREGERLRCRGTGPPAGGNPPVRTAFRPGLAARPYAGNARVIGKTAAEKPTDRTRLLQSAFSIRSNLPPTGKPPY